MKSASQKFMDGIAQYQKISTQSEIESASPTRLIELLLDGAVTKLRVARGFMHRGQIAQKCQHIDQAINIIDGLRGSLNHEAGGEVASRLDPLYEYMIERLVLANLRNDLAIIDEVLSLISEIQSGWSEMKRKVDGLEHRPAVETLGA